MSILGFAAEVRMIRRVGNGGGFAGSACSRRRTEQGALSRRGAAWRSEGRFEEREGCC